MQGGGQKMKLKHMKVLQEIQAICEGEVNGGCSGSCPFFDGGHCLFMLIPKYWELDKFKIEG